MGLMTNLPSFLTPPRAKQHFRHSSYPESPPDSPDSDTDIRPLRYRAGPRLNSYDDNRRNSQPPPSSFVMPGERAATNAPSSSFVMPGEHRAATNHASSSFVMPGDQRPSALPPSYQRAVESSPHNGNRRVSQPQPGPSMGAPPHSFGARQDPNQSTSSFAASVPPGSNFGSDDISNYLTILKDWKRQQTSFTSTFSDPHAFSNLTNRLVPSLESLLHPLCAPPELQICLRHFDQESRRIQQATTACAKSMRDGVRDAWNELVVLGPEDSQARSPQHSPHRPQMPTPPPPAAEIMNRLRRTLDDAYDQYVKSVENSKENLWYTLDFNVDCDGNGAAFGDGIRERFCAIFNKMMVERDELNSDGSGALPVLVLPAEMTVEGAPNGRSHGGPPPPPPPPNGPVGGMGMRGGPYRG